MAEGDRWRLYLAYMLAFGEKGIPGKIDPFATLIYELELVECPDAKRNLGDAREALLEAILPPERDPTSEQYVAPVSEAAPEEETERPQKKAAKKKNKKKKEEEEAAAAKAAEEQQQQKKKKKSKAKIGFAKAKKKTDDDDEL